MATLNQYGYAQWTSNGRSRTAGSLTAPTQTTYAGIVLENSGTALDATATQIYGSTSPGLSGVATWSGGFILVDQDCRVALRGNSDANSSIVIVKANVLTPMPSYQIPTYNATLATYIAGALVSTTQIWLYQDSGETANWQLFLAD